MQTTRENQGYLSLPESPGDSASKVVLQCRKVLMNVDQSRILLILRHLNIEWIVSWGIKETTRIKTSSPCFTDIADGITNQCATGQRINCVPQCSAGPPDLSASK
jgi:hypothetical protein